MNASTTTSSKEEVLAQDFLQIRAKLLEAAAGLDRIDRATGPLPAGDRRRDLLAEAAAIVAGIEPDRAERLQLLFSRAYDGQWREQYKL